MSILERVLAAVAKVPFLRSLVAGAPRRTLADDIPVAASWIAKALSSSGYKADFSPGSISEVERFFEEQTRDGRPVANGLLDKNVGARLFALSCYCGETLRREIGGEWITDDDDPHGEVDMALKLANGHLCWPGQRIMKRLNSEEDDLVFWAQNLRETP